MMKLLLVKEKCKEFYGKYDIYINPVLKFVLAFLALWMLKSTLGYMTRMNSLPVILVVALLCSLLPVGAVVMFAAVFMLGHIYAISLETFIICLVLFLIMFFAYYIFKPGDSMVLVVVPLLFWMKLPYLAPLVVGLAGTALSAVSVSFGVVVYYTILAVKQNATALIESDSSGMLGRFQLMVDQILVNRAMLVVVLAFAVTTVLVYIIHRLSVPHSWKIAVGTGAVAELAVILTGSTMMGVGRVDMPAMIIGIVVSALLALILEFFLFSVDYSRTEYVQFEDDDYYYYVKAVPKLTVTPPQREVKRFAVNQKGRERGLSETVDLDSEMGEVRDLNKDRIY